MKWLIVEATVASDDQYLEISRVMSVKKSGNKVTFVTDSGAQYTWKWDGKVASWGKLVMALNLSEQI